MSSISLPTFDAHHPPSAKLVSECVHCGFCLPTCPTYILWGNEADSPRGRIYLMKLGLENELPLNEQYITHFDRCLGCMACLTSCPSGVQYDQLIEATRAQIERRFERPASEKLLRKILFAVFPYPRRMFFLAIPLLFYQRTGLQKLIRGSGLLSKLPRLLQVMEKLAPRMRGPTFQRDTRIKITGLTGSWTIDHGQWVKRGPLLPKPSGTPRLRVGMLRGCVQRVFFDHVNDATMRVLAAEGCEIVLPQQAGCCGALMLHCGEEPQAIHFARRLIDAFEEAKVDVIAINSAGCGSAMKDYGRLLRDDPQYAQRAAAFSAKCRDISEILATLEPRAPRHPLPLAVAFHDACHLQHAQRITLQPRAVLGTIPGLQLLSINEPAICCGSAGIYNLLQPQAAAELGARKAQHVLNTGAQAVVTGNPGCMLQLASSCEALGKPLKVFHWIELLDASINGTTLHL